MRYAIDPFEARRALEGKPVSLTLGYSGDEVMPEDLGDEVKLGEFIVEKESLERIARKRFIYTLPELERIEEFHEGRYYRLFPVAPRVSPTLEISGVFMHRMKDVTPWRDAELKVLKARIRPGHKVLDTCMGLGYTAIHAYRRGADVTSVEISEAVIRIASKNPRSEDLKHVNVVHADVFDYVLDLEDESFDRIIHDPPRLSLAGELYSKDFYAELYRILKPGGVLYHYVGDPGGRYRRKKLWVGVAQRLRSVGFREVKRDEKTKGIIALRLRPAGGRTVYLRSTAFRL